MKTLTPMDLRRSLGQILDEASAGERFLIQRDHKPLAVLVSVEDAARLHEDAGEMAQRRDAALKAVEDWRRRVLTDRGPGAVYPPAPDFIRNDRDRGHSDEQRLGGADGDHGR